jgi:hypothetical protein
VWWKLLLLLAAVALGWWGLLQEGLANLVLVGGSTTLVRAKVEANLPRKRGPAIAGYDKAWEKFMDNVFQVGGCGWEGVCVWQGGGG